ncbi:type I restriction-modification system, specificity subunit S [Enterococcus sp. 7E2_DIV0204]|uniref:restriction endonuclease subunit S n=1 Tax=unclassified Enterococcus TaxID=2608891 RepID=UPI000A352456|nr:MULTISPECIES: restriction endonuclease subunit S [unclassified Enterococcus]OTN90044.1 type I restriction-modification system, specificity subunit S [Enterococcus sp. 7E2_DIV0204]OTP52499.1 type I restriction-modification system, specificity subunit S [Enterococcus sp. 7D2_DIV0200]
MKNKKQPEIRLQGFEGDWDQLELGEISDKVTEKNKNNEFTETFTNSAKFGIMSQRDYFDKDISNEKNLNGYYVVREDDFVYNPRISNFAPVGPINRNKLGRTGVMSPLYYVFRIHSIDKIYLEYFFYTTAWHNFMKLNGDSGARSDRFAIKDSVFKSMPIPYPSKLEQQKIGSFFKQLDDAITLHQQKLMNLKQTKQGFLQKMFPKEGEKVPEIRFPGFTEAWEPCELGKIVKITMGQSPNGKNYTQNSDDYVLVQGNADMKNGRVVPRVWTTQVTKQAEKGDLILSVRAPVGDIGKTDYDVVLGRGVAGIKGNEFIFQLLVKMKQNGYWSKLSTGSTFESINSNDIKEASILAPKEKEQKKIGDFFRSLDETITLHQRELDLLQETKKAFLQKMFI